MHPWRLTRRAFPFAVVLALVATVIVGGSGPASGPSAAAPAVTQEPAKVYEHAVPAPEPVATQVAPTPAPTAAPTAEPKQAPKQEPTQAPAKERQVVAELPKSTVESYSMLGVTWDPTTDSSDLGVDVRWRENGAWTDWTELHLDLENTTTEGGRPGTEPQWVGSSDGVAVRVTSDKGVKPADLKVATIDPGATDTLTPVSYDTASYDTSAATLGSTAVTQAATVSRPAIVMRSSWGASDKGRCDSPLYGETTRGAVIHHTAGSNTYSKSQSAGIVKATQAYHTGSRKWCDIGYNFLVDKYGQIFEGRKGGIDKTVRAAHSGNGPVNQETMGVSLMGTFTKASPTSAMKTAVANLVSWRFADYKVPAKGTYKLGGKTLNRIAGHRNVVGTECPGATVYAWLSAKGGLRDAVSAKLAGGSTPATSQVAKYAAKLGKAKTGAVVRAEWGNSTKRRANFKNMDIAWETKAGVHYVGNYFRSEWNRLGGHSGVLGFPRSPQYSTSVSTVGAQRFQKGVVFRIKSGTKYAAYGLYGPLAAKYIELKEFTGVLGVPRTSVYTARAGVTRVKFTKGYLEYTASTGAVGVFTVGGTTGAGSTSQVAKYAAKLGQAKTGAVVRAEWGNSTKRRANFKNMDIAWETKAGVHYVANYFRSQWNRLGGHSGVLGFPRSSQYSTSVANVGVQRFQKGSVFRVKTGTKYAGYGLYGPLATKYVELKEVNGVLGVPRTSVYTARAGVTRVKFTKGYLEYTASTGKVGVFTVGGATPSSTADSLTVPSSRAFTLRGHGYGHGIGMSQYGAQGAALAGKKYDHILSTYYPGTKIGTKTGNIRVLLKAATSTTVTVNAKSGMKFRIVATNKPIVLPTTASGKKITQWRIVRLTKDPRQSVLQYRTSGWVTYKNQIWTGDAQLEAPLSSLVLIMPNGKGVEYRSILRSSVPAKGSTDRDTINLINIENYVRGVVPREMPSSWKSEALKAQSVAARTYGVRSMSSSRYYDICDTTACQVYQGVSAEAATTNAAISATSGRILTYGGTPAFTQFSSSSGGYSDTGSQPYLKGKADPYDGFSGNPVHNWSISVKASTIEKAYPAIGSLKTVKITKRNGLGDWGGRVSAITFGGSKSSKSITGNDARWLLGLRSNWFRVN